jgi:hypothetical protein
VTPDMQELARPRLLGDDGRVEHQSVMVAGQALAFDYLCQNPVDLALRLRLARWLISAHSARIPTVAVAGARTFALSVMVPVTM